MSNPMKRIETAPTKNPNLTVGAHVTGVLADGILRAGRVVRMNEYGAVVADNFELVEVIIPWSLIQTVSPKPRETW